MVVQKMQASISRECDLAHASPPGSSLSPFAVASTLQSALDDWDRISPKLADLAEALEEGTARHIFRSIQPNAQVIRPLAQRGSVAPASVRQSDVAWSVFLALYCSSTPDISTFKRK
jgi:Fumarylacetoacetase N-terminal domain 2